MMLKLGLLLILMVSSGCASDGPRRFTSPKVVWQDNDRRPIVEPESYWSGLYWDGADQMFFRPLSHAFLLESWGPALNTNALDEVPNSSWYTNRMALRQLPTDEVIQGPCVTPINEDAVWVARSGKVDGANPGFVIEDSSDGRKYLLKFDEKIQIERATGADIIGSKIYWAAGFSTPCNRVVYFESKNLVIGEGASKKDALGRKSPILPADITAALGGAPRRADGRIRAAASLFLPGKPKGPFKYQETFGDDPNDVIPHEDRRELRGSKMLAAWLNHFDAREQNTFTTFIPSGEDGRGFVQHHILDFGDCFGSQWEADAMSRRFGHSAYFDIGHILGDFASLGIVRRPWEDSRQYPEEGPIFGYYDVAGFDPDTWQNGYPHPAFSRADEVDDFWGAKIISRFDDKMIRDIVQQARFSDPRNEDYLVRTLVGRRDKIVRTNFDRLSPFETPQTQGMGFCASDIGVSSGYYKAEDSHYEVAFGNDDWNWVEGRPDGTVCVDMLNAPFPGDYLVARLRVRRTHQREPARPTQFHFMVKQGHLWAVGLDRYDSGFNL